MADKLVPANDVVHVEIDPIGLPERRRQEMSLETFRQIDDEIFVESASGVKAMLAFQEISPGQEEPPPEWVKELGSYAKAVQKLRVAKATWMCQSEAPVGLKYLQAVYIGQLRVRAGDKLQQNTLNVSVVQVIDPQRQYPELEVEERK